VCARARVCVCVCLYTYICITLHICIQYIKYNYFCKMYIRKHNRANIDIGVVWLNGSLSNWQHQSSRADLEIKPWFESRQEWSWFSRAMPYYALHNFEWWKRAMWVTNAKWVFCTRICFFTSNLRSTYLTLKNTRNVYVFTADTFVSCMSAICFNHSFLRKSSCLRSKNGVILIE